ncbi:helix-turn-helix domain-containing protein [Parapedobacter koreensis]|uniref:Cro/C1-type HTH DNA-binding domain-containing protein n=1 Tax=Parapedobacter koreensis TaxID=332977 RepID=A0A1H7S922_9SPHI|nr:helix-turn-helix domain-containing protein [Parapedobacter koreensis]SEL69131.1 Cro/C1-type HTH DNA-binding domain-containing protein [Parapedobacter koreensis]
MKKEEVPQDNGSLAKKNVHELCYAVDENGRYTTVPSTGWEAKTLALNESLELIDERIAATRQAVLAGEASPIAYYMELHRMDVSLLASYVGIHRWFVKRHFQPKRFAKLSDKTLRKYADTFGITIEQLQSPFPHPNT